MPHESSLEAQYVNALLKEIHLQAGKYGKRTGILNAIYFGGGTPSVLSGKSIEMIFQSLGECFEIFPGAEITMEANPGTINEEKIREISASGINRLSIGIQSFNENELLTLGRLHSAKDAVSAVHVSRKAGIKNLSLDLIYGIPGQTPESWRHTVSRAIELKPEHISSYELTPEEGTPLYRTLKEDRLSLPDEDAVISMFDYARKAFENAGFEHYEISNFSLPGYECRHNLNYWQRGPYLGVGLGAHSFITGMRIKNTEDMGEYIRVLSKDILPQEEESPVSLEDALKETVFLGLRMLKGIRASSVRGLMEASTELIEGGFLELKDGNLRLTRDKGISVSNAVFVTLLQRLGL